MDLKPVQLDTAERDALTDARNALGDASYALTLAAQCAITAVVIEDPYNADGIVTDQMRDSKDLLQIITRVERRLETLRDLIARREVPQCDD